MWGRSSWGRRDRENNVNIVYKYETKDNKSLEDLFSESIKLEHYTYWQKQLREDRLGLLDSGIHTEETGGWKLGFIPFQDYQPIQEDWCCSHLGICLWDLLEWLTGCGCLTQWPRIWPFFDPRKCVFQQFQFPNRGCQESCQFSDYVRISSWY